MGIKEIATLAKVSPATVSLALNDKPGIGKKTRDRILNIAEELNYRIPERRLRPSSDNGTIHFLKLSRTGKILNSDLNVFINDYIDGIDKVVKEMNYKFQISSHTTEEIEIIVEESKEKSRQGMIILGTELFQAEIEALREIPIPTIIIDTNYDYMSSDFVNMNNISALNDIIGHFSSTGHTKAGIVSGSIQSGNMLLREKGFFEAAARFDMETGPDSVLRVRPSFDYACIDMLEIIRKGYKIPSALFCCNDIIAYGCIKAMKETGIRVPEDVSVIGFDDLPISAMMEPRLTTIRVSKKEIGSIAMQMLVKKINSGNKHHFVSIQVCGELIERDSVLNRKK